MAKNETITVIAKQKEGRWRAGFRFTVDPSEVEVTEDQKKAIEGDPLLSIVPNTQKEKKTP